MTKACKGAAVCLALLCVVLSGCGMAVRGEVPTSSQVSEPVGDSISKLISFRGTTVVPLGRLLVMVPGASVPSGNTGCMLEAAAVGSGQDYGLALDETVWDVRILCDREELQVLFGAITVRVEPMDRDMSGKQVYQRHGSGPFEPLALVKSRDGYVCGETERLSLFTLG
jgi:hypothetical protein